MNPSDFQESVRRYRSLLKEVAWMGEGMAWTVIVPESGSLSLDEVGRRVTGGAAPRFQEYEPGYADLTAFRRSGTSVMLFQAEGFTPVGEQPMLGRVSSGAQVWHVQWNITGARRLLHAAGGEVVAEVYDFDPKEIRGTNAEALREEAALLGGTRDAFTVRARAMAIVERRTNVRLAREWLDHPQPSLEID